MDGRRLAPLAGLAFFVLAIISFAVSGEPPDASDPAQELVDFYTDNEGAQMVSTILEALAAAALVFFGGLMRRVLRDAEGEGHVLSAVAFAGTIIIATGLAFDATIAFTLTDSAGEIEPESTRTLVALYNTDFMPMAVGTFVFMLATGLSVLRHGALPKWIGAIAVLLAVIAVTPIGFAAFIGMGILVLIMSVMLFMKAGAADRPTDRPAST